ncbi:hypothetical protein ACFQH6_09725 [Halobacteriaceae archaeon GCM10025711]
MRNRSPSCCFLADERGDIPMRVMPLLLLGLILIVLAVLGTVML